MCFIISLKDILLQQIAEQNHRFIQNCFNFLLGHLREWREKSFL
jgi:hypothetical protein